MRVYILRKIYPVGVAVIVQLENGKILLLDFSTHLSWSNENKSCMRVNESRQARVCMRVFSTLMSWSSENKSCMRVDES